MLRSAREYPWGDVYPDSCLVENLRRWVVYRVPPGTFLQAILRNDLLDACLSVAPEHARFLTALVLYCHRELPAMAWGSAANVEAWAACTPEEHLARLAELGIVSKGCLHPGQKGES